VSLKNGESKAYSGSFEPSSLPIVESGESKVVNFWIRQCEDIALKVQSPLKGTIGLIQPLTILQYPVHRLDKNQEAIDRKNEVDEEVAFGAAFAAAKALNQKSTHRVLNILCSRRMICFNEHCYQCSFEYTM
jgi:hypothetical protein